MRSFVFIPVVLLFSCSDYSSKLKSYTLNFGSFTIETPEHWKKIKAQGIDSYIGKIAIDSKDTLWFDLGWYSNTLTEDEDIDSDEHRKNSVLWDTIDHRKAKIVFPIKSGIGITGVYIDSLWQSGSDIDRFNLYGVNLKTENEKILLQAIKTLRFYKKPAE